jgi:hypothetical protein
MSDEPNAPPAPAPAPAAPMPEAAAPAAPGPSERLAELQADKDWVSDFNGDNGRIAQKQAAERKSDLLRGDQPDTAPAMPEHLREALEAGETKPHAERYVPASDPSEYKFDWPDAESVERAQEMTALAQETAFAVGANPEFARATVRHVQERLSRVPEGGSVGYNPGSLDEAVAELAGPNSASVLADATEAVTQMPEAGRQWVQATLRGLDPNTAAWFTARLARAHRATRP